MIEVEDQEAEVQEDTGPEKEKGIEIEEEVIEVGKLRKECVYDSYAN